ncbi:hypothetical protein DICSQDRAFT_124031 [Dichomitus squalens LYAD-421 SS1]|uniref:uncharacterized protein n=1 Tax=Dichomitus squalens (strain LYAD-421) TaxID=732165 RepID=UPI0004412E3F|nr:uncharacterized protein DICSQDRAFT_124031 [Dichomitus squalens LYAD-421 SS1]EJF65928.1 hypothetical protein DICSQDRAFT_124031 [Dichomitus squalens LYAD-421 SS1]
MDSTIGADSQEELQDLMSYLVATEIFNFTDLAVFVVILYEYLITVDREVHFAWGRKLSWARCVFLLNRYLTILVYLVVLGPLLPTVNTFNSLTYFYRAFAGIRIYAISARNRVVSVIVVALALVPAVTNAYVSTLTPVAVTPQGCMGSMNLSIITWTTLTWIKTWSTIRAAERLNVKMSFTNLVLKEGMLYFSIALSLNIVQIIFDFVEVDDFSLILPFLNMFTPILISRFFLDLDDLVTTHDPQSPWTTLTGTGRQAIESTIRFADLSRATSSYPQSAAHITGFHSEGGIEDIDSLFTEKGYRPSETW